MFIIDKCLPFGGRRSPGIFRRLTQSVKRMMIKRGLTGIIVYLDDFLIVAETFLELPATHTAQGQVICRNFNSSRGCTWLDCNYAHMCNKKENGVACGSPHPAVHHTPPHRVTPGVSPAGAGGGR